MIKKIHPCSIIKTSFRDSKNCNVSPFVLSIMHLPHIYYIITALSALKNLNNIEYSILR